MLIFLWKRQMLNYKIITKEKDMKNVVLMFGWLKNFNV